MRKCSISTRLNQSTSFEQTKQQHHPNKCYVSGHVTLRGDVTWCVRSVVAFQVLVVAVRLGVVLVVGRLLRVVLALLLAPVLVVRVRVLVAEAALLAVRLLFVPASHHRILPYMYM